MQEYIFSFNVSYNQKSELSLEQIKSSIKGALNDKVDRYLGVVTERYGTINDCRWVECTLRVINRDDLPVAAIEKYLSNLSGIFEITGWKKR